MLDYNELVKFMKEFKVDQLNRYDELIVDQPSGTVVNIRSCTDMSEVKLRLVYDLCRPVGKGLEDRPAKRILDRFNAYFQTTMKRKDFTIMYEYLCTESQLNELAQFIQDGFPMKRLKKEIEKQ